MLAQSLPQVYYAMDINVTVRDIDSDAVNRLVDEGAKSADSGAELAFQTEAIITVFQRLKQALKSWKNLMVSYKDYAMVKSGWK